MREKFRSFAARPISMKAFLVLFSAVPLFYFLSQLVCAIYDSDMYFLIATGREILAEGIPHTNPWTIDKNCGIVVQQWLYDVVLAFVDRAGYMGFTLFAVLELAIFAFAWMRFFRFRKIPASTALCMLVFTCMPAQHYLFSMRPQVITMILVLETCNAMEGYFASCREDSTAVPFTAMWRRESRRFLYLAEAIALAVLEMQFHASMWPLHFAVIFAYCAPAFYMGLFGKPLEGKAAHGAIGPVIGACIIAVPCMAFLNPYGLDGFLYLFKSFKAHTFDYVTVLETQPPEILSVTGAAVILCAVLFVLAWKAGTLQQVSANMTAGFGLLMMAAVRNNTCSVFVLAFLTRDIAVLVEREKGRIDWKKDLTVSILPLLLFADVFFFSMFASECSSVFSGSCTGTESELREITAEIRKDYDEGMHLFTGFNCGAYLEYEGFRNLYIDARPELYTLEFTGGKDILSEYSRCCIYGYDVRRSPLTSQAAGIRPVTDVEMEAWLAEYGFDYMVVSPMSETFLSAYLSGSDAYEMVDSVGGSYYVLYRKRQQPAGGGGI